MSQREYNSNSGTVHCSQPDCESYAVSRGMCSKHYQRWLRHRDPNVVLTSTGHPKPELNPKLQCQVVGCSSRAERRGWCAKHYKRFLRHGSTEITGKPGRTSAREIDILDLCRSTLEPTGCNNLARAHGLCDKHLRLQAICRLPGYDRYHEPNNIYCSQHWIAYQCIEDEHERQQCKNGVYREGRCRKHYRQFVKAKRERGEW